MSKYYTNLIQPPSRARAHLHVLDSLMKIHFLSYIASRSSLTERDRLVDDGGSAQLEGSQAGQGSYIIILILFFLAWLESTAAWWLTYLPGLWFLLKLLLLSSIY